MNDTRSRLKRTLNYVAHTTRVTDRLAQIKHRRRRAAPRFAAAAAAFALVTAAVGLPFILGSSAPREPALQAGSTAPELDPPTTALLFDPSWFTADPEDIDAIIAASGSEDAGAEGWRPPLAAESAWCLFSPTGTPGVSVSASDFPLDQPLTEAILVDWCASYSSYAEGPAPEAFTVCRGVFADSFYAQTADELFSVVIEGDPTGPKPGFPVVLAWEADCDTEELTTSPAATLDSGLSYDDINRAREVEIATRARTLTACLSLEMVTELALAARAQVGEEWVVTGESQRDLVANGCYTIEFDIQLGVIFVPGEASEGDSRESSPSTLPPTTAVTAP